MSVGLGKAEEVCCYLLCGSNRDCSDAMLVILATNKAISVRINEDVLDFFKWERKGDYAQRTSRRGPCATL
ncbi:hypothetical protein XH87_00750 [Bradyrhizobium sp. CCBAU 53415]|nr:hypothetical protein [Bradyrhizobium sp. CCBAU 53415]